MWRGGSSGLAFAIAMLLGVIVGCGNGPSEGDPSAESVIAVRVGEITRATLRRRVTTYGRVEPAPAAAANPGGGSRLAAPVAGIVAEVLCAEGQRVAEGALLFRLESPVADVAIRFGETEVGRQRTLLASGGTSEQALKDAEQRLETARAEREQLRIHAPFAGVVERIRARPGEAVSAGSILGELTDPEDLVATAGVPADEARGLSSGRPVEITAAGGPVVAGSLLHVGSTVDPTTGLVPVRVSLPAGAGLLSGEFVRLDIISEERIGRLSVPVASVVRSDADVREIAIVEGDRATRIPIAVGLRDGDRIEIEGEGLRPGLRVVTEGAYGLPAKSRIRELP